MKILLTIHHHLDPNTGAPGVTWKLGQEYQKLGHQVRYYSFDHLPSRLPGLAKKVIFPEFVAAHLSMLSNKQAVDVVDASTGDAWVWAKVLQNSRENHPLLVTRSHGLEHTRDLELQKQAQKGNLHLSWKYSLYKRGFRLWEVATSLRCADLVFLLNRQDSKYAIEQLGVKQERTRIIPNGIPETFLNLTFEPTPEAENSTIYIAQVGSYIRRKGIQYSVPALNKILARYPQVQVSFLGTSCSEAEVHKDFDPALRDRIRVMPRYTHEMLPTFLKGHQIKLFSSLSEGFGSVLIEAMACGLTPITTAIPGPTEIVSDGHDGISIPPGDSRAIEQAIEQLISNHLYLERLRRNAYATAQRYSWTRIARENLSIYEEALSKKKCSSEKLSP